MKDFMTTWKDRLKTFLLREHRGLSGSSFGSAGWEMKLENLVDQELTTLFARIEEIVTSNGKIKNIDEDDGFRYEMLTKLHTLKQEYGVESK